MTNAKRNEFIKDAFNREYISNGWFDMGYAEDFDKIIDYAYTAESTPTTDGDVHKIASMIWENTSCHTMEELEQSVYDILSTAHRVYSDAEEDTATTKIVRTINRILKNDIVSVDYENTEIIIDGEDGYTIVCDDGDDMYNTLSNMLQGMMLLRDSEINR